MLQGEQARESKRDLAAVGMDMAEALKQQQRRAARRRRKNLVTGLLFLAPNILGFMSFMLLPLLFSLVLAFSNWDLTRHNMFKDESISFVGFRHFANLITHRDFFKYLGNTLFFMMGIPLSIAGSLILALLLSKDLRGGHRRVFGALVGGAILAASVLMLLVAGAEASAFAVMLTGLVGLTLLVGVVGGSSVYRTLFYLPSFTSGVAVFILWKQLYNPHMGPLNNFLVGPLESLTAAVRSFPGVGLGMWLCLAGVLGLLFLGLHKFRRMYIDGELGAAAAIFPTLLLLLPTALWLLWAPGLWAGYGLLAASAVLLLVELGAAGVHGKEFPCARGIGFGSAAMLAGVLMVTQFVLLGLALVFRGLPVWAGAADGLTPPEWLTDYHWAKPAIMIMGLWGGIGSNNMLLYLAGLSNVPQDLYEAADIDGASRFQKFWQVTWPQLAPTTFFIVVMSVIGGLQGGFEMARTMTQGGPAGATTTMVYYIYTEGFETGRLGYSSAVAWVLFLLVFSVTLFNWKFGNRYVNE